MNRFIGFCLSALAPVAWTGCGALTGVEVPHIDATDASPACAAVPVRVLYIVDVSASLAFTDPTERRLAALQTHLAAQAPATEVGFVTFGAVTAQFGFQPAATFAWPDTLTALQENSDLEGGLFEARALLRSDAAHAAGARYQVVILTDGAYGPRCCSGPEETGSVVEGLPGECAVPAWVEAPQPGDRACEGSLESAVCNADDFLTTYRASTADYGPDAHTLLGFVANADRNRRYRLGALLRELEDTVLQAGAASVRIDLVHVSNPTLSAAIQRVFQLDSCVVAAEIDALAAEALQSSALHVDTRADFSLPVLAGRCAGPP